MKLLPAIAIILLPNISFGQDLVRQKVAIDLEVQRISNQSDLKAATFSIQTSKKVLHYISYWYVENAKECVKISRQFSYKNDTVRQDFYLKDGGLIYAAETIVSYFTDKGRTDSIGWSGSFYFAKGRLIDFVTLGHGKSEIESWNPEQEMLAVFDESKRDIARFKKKR